MRKFFGITLVFLSLNCLARIEKVPLDDAFVEVQDGMAKLTFEGYLPDTCYGEPKAEVYKSKGVIFVDVVSNVTGQACAEMARFFELEIALGSFRPGTYSVLLQKSSRWARDLFFEVN